jgi:putative beta barrel porin BBP7
MSRFALLVAIAFVSGTSFIHAQSGQVYWGGGAYPPTMPTPVAPPGYHGYPPQMQGYPPQMQGYPPQMQGYPPQMQPVNPAQYPMAQFTPYRPAPVYYPPPAAYDPGVNYYPMQNPLTYMPPSAPTGPAGERRVPAKTMGWPNPPGAATDDDGQVIDDANGYTDIRRPLPPVPYHRTPNEHCFGSLGYVGMFFRPMRFSSPLVTTGSLADAAPGALGQPGTRILFGRDTTDYGLMSGIQGMIGAFLDTENRYSLEVGGFWVFRANQSFGIAGDANGNPSISRPIFNIVNGTEGAFINSLPGTVTGRVNVDTHAEIGGFEINARQHWYTQERLHVDALFGFRYLRLAESLQITESLNTIQPRFVTFNQAPIGVGSTLLDDDRFGTTNQFFGPQIGGRLSWEQKWFTASAFGKLGIGVTHEATNISGSTTVLSPTGVVTGSSPAGILALPTNIGNHSRTVFGILPEFGLNLGIDLTQCVRLNLGYSILMWNHVVRPGGQFDRNINPALAPSTPGPLVLGGAQGPIYRFNDEFFWVNSFNVGLEFHY